MDLKITFIAAEQTFPLRKEVLQPKGVSENLSLENDFEPSTFHLGGFVNDRLVTIGTFHKVNHPQFKEPFQYQLRKMATSPDFQSTGGGKKLLEFGLAHLNKIGTDLLWCNAREKALGFYERLGFKAIDDFFDVPGIGPHKLMFIHLK